MTAERICAHHDIPVIFVTAYADDATLQRAKVAGPFGYIVKPFDERELYSTIEIALNKHRTEREIKKCDDILFAIGGALEWFLRRQNEQEMRGISKEAQVELGILEILEHIGLAVSASSISIFSLNNNGPDTSISTLRYTWIAPGALNIGAPPRNGPSQMSLGLSDWPDILTSGSTISGNVCDFPENGRKFLESYGISSIAIIPLFRNDAIWGFIWFSDTQARDWSVGEIEALRIVGNLISAVMICNPPDLRSPATGSPF
jgi:CheY-like chemotaxis protein